MDIASINHEQVRKVAAVIKTLPPKAVLNFYSFNDDGTQDPFCKSMYPELGHPNTVDFLSFMGMQNHGYWTLKGDTYQAPIFGTLDGKTGVKGSDLLWQMAKRTFDKDPWFFTPRRLADVAYDDLVEKVFSDDNGPLPFRDLDARHDITNAYGEWFLTRNTTPANIVQAANRKESPLQHFLQVYSDIPGYDEDPLEKKNVLTAMSLANRPERLLNADPWNPDWTPIVDYHLMRFALRSGMVRLAPRHRDDNIARRLVDDEVEFAIRLSTYHVVDELIIESGKTMAAVDLALWSARKFCPEDYDLSKIRCGECMYSPACIQDKELFQPVLETTNY
jgi:hypothetical protein